MSDNTIVESSYFSFEEYKQLVEKYRNDDAREINFQNRIILQLLDKIFINDKEIEIVDVSTQYKNRESEQHTRVPYANVYTPDLLIVKNWKYCNKAKAPNDYLAVVEVKSPALDPICEENTHTLAEIKDYQNIGCKVILTDCYIWEFYGFDKEKKEFILYKEDDWVMEEVNNSEFIVDEFGFPETRKESKVWNELCAYIREKIQ